MPFTLEIGQKAVDFSLRGVDDKPWSLANFNDKRLLIVVFTCNHCPYVVNSLDRQKTFYETYSPRGVGYIAINANSTENHPDDSFEHMKLHVKEHGIPWPYVRDESQEVARAYGALRTPHYYLFDEARTLRYTGRMDDNPRNAGMEKTHELADAVDALSAGRPVPVAVTNPIGCNVKWKGKPEKWMPPEACDLV